MLCENTGCSRGENGSRKEFEPKRAWQKFCCNECRNDFHKEGSPLQIAVKRYLKSKQVISDLGKPVPIEAVIEYHAALEEMKNLTGQPAEFAG